jgi:hypothetical protein
MQRSWLPTLAPPGGCGFFCQRLVLVTAFPLGHSRKIDAASVQKVDHFLRLFLAQMGAGQDDTLSARKHQQIPALRIGRFAPG